MFSRLLCCMTEHEFVYDSVPAIVMAGCEFTHGCLKNLNKNDKKLTNYFLSNFESRNFYSENQNCICFPQEI